MITFNFQNAQFDYEPYPICYIPNFIDADIYTALQESYPPIELFRFIKGLGAKYSLAEMNHANLYYDYLKKHEAWREFYHTIKSKPFVQQVFSFLRDHEIDLNVRRFIYTGNVGRKRRGPIWRIANKRMLRSRFEYSVMRADGGHILPHTDKSEKLVTLVLSFIGDNEWKEEWGGGTDVLTTKKKEHIFCLEGQRPFEEVKRLKSFPFVPNQAVLFIKTYNSWHSVMPMTGPHEALRKTVTINIENIT